MLSWSEAASLVHFLTPGGCPKVFASSNVQMYLQTPQKERFDIESRLHCSGASLFEVLLDPENDYFRCDILCRKVLACVAILMHSDDGECLSLEVTIAAHKHNNWKHFFPPQQSLCSYNAIIHTFPCADYVL